MKAVVCRGPFPIDDPRAVEDTTLPDPVAQGRDLLVRVHAISVNPIDTKVRRRMPPDSPPKVLGWDASGVVEAIGPDCALFRPGDEVFYAGSVIRPGTNSELHLVDERIVGRKPKTLSFAQAAALPLTSITAWEMLFDRLQVSRGSISTTSFLLIGGGGGVGSITIQLARQLTGLRIIATASRPETREWCLELGAHDVIDHHGDMPEQFKALDAPPLGLVFSTNQTDMHWKAIASMVAPTARIGLIDDPGPFDITLIKMKSASLHWETMFTRSLFQTSDMQAQHELLNELAGLVESGAVRSTLAEEYGPINATNLRRAHAMLESGRSRGKIVLEGFG
jgi:zinc-binding alcohol dehydrogenase family protein